MKRLEIFYQSHWNAGLSHTYTDKIEVYDPTQGSYILQSPIYEGADYHNVTVDLQFSLIEGNSATSTYRAHRTIDEFNMDHVRPIKTIDLEGEVFPCPHDPEQYLTTIYGYIGKNARFNPDTGKYEKRKETLPPYCAE